MTMKKDSLRYKSVATTYKDILEFEKESEEFFLDQFEDINPITFMAWCLGKGYIKSRQYDKWSEAFEEGQIEALDPNYFVYSAIDHAGTGAAEFAMIVSPVWNEEDHDRSLHMVAEFIADIEVYREGLFNFFFDE
jgi:hypothetical protein